MGAAVLLDVQSDEEVIGASAYSYSTELLVELTCRDPETGLVVYSYPFQETDDGGVAPLESVPGRHREAVGEALAEKGYEAATVGT